MCRELFQQYAVTNSSVPGTVTPSGHLLDRTGPHSG